jgi:predicted nucleic acid-binding protein
VGELTPAIQDKLVFFDSAPLIYYIERHSRFSRVAEELFEALDQGTARGLTSVLTLVEVLTKPFRNGREDIAREYREVLTEAVGITLSPIDGELCNQAARLRAKYQWLRTPDAIQVACSLQHKADLIVTNDERWKRLTEIPVIVLQDYAGAKP